MKNLLRNFWLTLTRFKTASILNILGLTVAITVFTAMWHYFTKAANANPVDSIQK